MPHHGLPALLRLKLKQFRLFSQISFYSFQEQRELPFIMTTPRVFVIRHGETEWSLNGRYVFDAKFLSNGPSHRLSPLYAF